MNVLFVCIGNQGRSTAGAEHGARSAGAAPGGATHPEVLAALSEIGIDASDHVPTQLDQGLLDWADVVVATCDGACPVTPGKRRLDWHVRDPMHRPDEEVRAIRDEIRDRVGVLLSEL